MCQADGSWSPVSLGCEFIPAAVLRNMQRDSAVEWEDNEEINLMIVVPVAVIGILIILSFIIAFIVVSHRQNSAAMRARKLSRLNGVKVLPDLVIQQEADDFMVSDIYTLSLTLFCNCVF